MTAQEKFEARLKELGFNVDGIRYTGYGAIQTDDCIIVMVHYYESKEDPFSELHYHRFDKMNIGEVGELTRHFASEYFSGGDKEDAEFLRQLALWCADSRNPTPLYPADVYPNIEPFETIEFKDDVEKPSVNPLESVENIIPYLIGDKDVALANIYQTYRACKVAEAEESIFDINNANDMKMLCDLYPFKVIMDAVGDTGCRFLLGGTNYTNEPMPVKDIVNLVNACWVDVSIAIKTDPDMFNLDIMVDNLIEDVARFEEDSEESEYNETVESNAVKCDDMRGQIREMRASVLSMIDGELSRGHNLQKGFDPYPGWGSWHLYGYIIEGKTLKVWKRGDGLLFLALEQEGYETENINLFSDDFPVEVLMHIYESMR